MSKQPKAGDLRIWHNYTGGLLHSQFTCDISSLAAAKEALNILRSYDKFRDDGTGYVNNNIISVSGLEVFVCLDEDNQPAEKGDWEEWYDDLGLDIDDAVLSPSAKYPELQGLEVEVTIRGGVCQEVTIPDELLGVVFAKITDWDNAVRCDNCNEEFPDADSLTDVFVGYEVQKWCKDCMAKEPNM